MNPAKAPDRWQDLVQAVRAFALAMYGDAAVAVTIHMQHLPKAVHPLPPAWMFEECSQSQPSPAEESTRR